MNNIDIDRLHKNIEEIHKTGFLPRGEGATTARLLLLLGAIEVCDPGSIYFYVGENHNHVRDIARRFDTLLQTYNIQRTWYREYTSCSLLETNVNIYFTSPSIFVKERTFRGYRLNKIFFDVTKRQQHQLDANGELSEIFDYLQSIGADII